MVNSLKFLLSATLLMLLSLTVQSQIIAPPKWDIKFTDQELTVGEESSITFKAQIPRNWYIYSNDFEDVGPIQISLKLEDSIGIVRKGELVAINPKTKFDDVWDNEVKYFDKEGNFIQNFLISSKDIKIAGFISYQMCSDVSGQCIPFEEDFTLTAIVAGKKKSRD
ncbi:MAG TPA: protein-disulfide reductase DsbD domain-containing protein [Anditalea sp.]|nr:protein-disulfide reductase DsbD domain-containing protein [Anditalea sp.]